MYGHTLVIKNNKAEPCPTQSPTDHRVAQISGDLLSVTQLMATNMLKSFNLQFATKDSLRSKLL